MGIFIDIQNLYHSAKNLYRGRVNYNELVKNLIAGRKVVRTIGYVVKSEGIIENTGSATGAKTESSFFDALEKAGIELRMKDIQIFPGGSKKADWDVGMAVDAIRMAPLLDTIILVTGDGDFVPLIQYLDMNEGCQVEVMAFGKSSSSKIKEAADKFYDLDKDPKEFLRARDRFSEPAPKALPPHPPKQPPKIG